MIEWHEIVLLLLVVRLVVVVVCATTNTNVIILGEFCVMLESLASCGWQEGARAIHLCGGPRASSGPAQINKHSTICGCLLASRAD